MFVNKRRHQRSQSSTPTSTPPRKLFADYPYPVITELSKSSGQRKKADHSHRLRSLQWYKDSFHRLFGIAHHSDHHHSPISVTEQSFRQVHTGERLSEGMVKSVQNKARSTHAEGKLVSSITPPSSDEEEQNNRQYLRTRYTINGPHPIQDAAG